MPKKIKRVISGFLVAYLCVALFLSFAVYQGSKINADSSAATTTVTVSNTAPTINTAHENPASYATTPTNVGSDVTFHATGTDGNGDSYYLAICKSSGITAGVGGAAPTCDGGAWVISSTAVASGVEEVLTYTVQSGDTNQTYAWYAYVCDNNSGGALCSSADQGAGDSASPFSVNHRPTFTSVSDDGPKNPGATDLTITASSYNDTDTDGSQDTVSMYVCKSNDFTGSACGGGGTWCSVTGVTPTNTLACDLTIPSPQAHGTINYYAYVIDSHSFAASGGQQGALNTFSVNDVAPTISGTPTLNGAAAINLTAEKSTTDIYIRGVITDDNGCSDINAASTTADAWLTSITRSACNTSGEANNNNCYPRVTCSYDDTVESCGADDKTGGYKCTVSLQYYTNPTDDNTPWSASTWTGTLVPADGQGVNAAGEANTAAQEMNSFLALSLANSYDAIAYGNIAAGSNTVTLEEKIRVEAAGNVGLDTNLSGTTMTGPGTAIPIANQHYAATAVAYASGTALSGTPTEIELEVCKSGYTGTPELKALYWGVAIPSGQVAGSYTGSNTITAVKDDWSVTGDWCES